MLPPAQWNELQYLRAFYNFNQNIAEYNLFCRDTYATYSNIYQKQKF